VKCSQTNAKGIVEVLAMTSSREEFTKFLCFAHI
jgi:hypothetical protein